MSDKDKMELKLADLEQVAGADGAEQHLIGMTCTNCGHLGVIEEDCKRLSDSLGNVTWQFVYRCPACDFRIFKSYSLND